MDNPKKIKRKILVTQALPYANAPLHLGHILEAVQTDIWTRFQNINNNECYFFCADDTHGTPVMLKANELGITPEELIQDVYEDHKSTYELYDIKFANFHSTHSDENKKFSIGSIAIAKKIAGNTKSNSLVSIVGGGDTIAAIKNTGLDNSFTHLSTAGGAFLESLEGKELPGIKVLKKN